MRMGNQLWTIFAFAIGSSLSFMSCGNSTTDVTFTVQYSAELKSIIQAAHTTARVYYTYNGFRPRVVVQPQEAIPLSINTGTTDQPQTSFNWATATGPGFELADGKVQLQSLPLEKQGVEIAIEFIQQKKDGQFYVVGVYCYTGPAAANLTEAQLKADATLPALARKGRSCGSCGTYQNPTVDSAGHTLGPTDPLPSC